MEKGMKEYTASASIKGSPEEIWTILTDAAKFQEWDTGLDHIEGRIAPDQTIKVYSKVSPGRAFPVKVTEFNPGRRMVWSGGMPLGLFKGVRTFTLAPAADGTTNFSMREEFSGPLLPLIGKTMPDLGPTFTQFAKDLKARAEGTAATP
jgi:hypothetical protein